MTLEWLLILRIQRGFILVFHRDLFALRHPVGGTPFHPHLPEINIFQLFVRTAPIICWLMCMFMFFVVVLIVLLVLKFCLYCVLSCFVCMYYYVSMVLFCVYGRMYIALVWKNGVCQAPKLKLRINQSINQ